MGARQSMPPMSPSPSTPSLSPLSLSPLTPLTPLTPSNMCEDSRKQVEKIIRATEELNIKREELTARSGRIGSSFHRRRFFCSYLL